jgi:ribosomal 50S subunit-associated protein YjgA (DUF615 family)
MSLEDKIKALLEGQENNTDTDLSEGESAGEDNTKIEAGKKNKLEDKKVTGEPSSDEPNNKRNNVDKSPVSEDHLATLMSGEDLSEDFKLKAAVILETAINEGVTKELARLAEEHEAQLVEAVEEVRAELVENLDGFLNLVVENWVKENAVAIERGIKSEITENFIDGLKNLFKEHYIDVPEEKFDILDEQTEKIEQLVSKLEEQTEQINTLTQEINEAKKSLTIESVGSELSDTDFEKFSSLCENISYSEEFENKAKTILEKYFPKTSKATVDLSEDSGIKSAVVDTTMTKYVEALSGSLKF